ncbi:ferredoxin--NADP reductase [Streptomyces sp. NPDC059894]|uniref:ferredoxin--NADP reductase n=1 Tax=unclassified Streptomyces TaxID=2593676 RepID=UPI003648A1C6
MGIFTKTPMTFAEVHEEDDGVHAFSFVPTKPLSFVAGQHGVLKVPGAGQKTFSLASAPEDPEVVIATRLQSGSAYKNALAALRPNDPVTLQGPMFNFTLKGTPEDVVFLAQGIGITPFRSILRHISAAGVAKRTHLVHVSGTQTPTYRAETQDLATTALYPTQRDDFALAVKELVAEKPGAVYFVSGATDFLKGTVEQLTQLGVGKKQIRKDRFVGY